MGQGGPYTSIAPIIDAIGKPVASIPGGVLAGSPTVELSGAPLSSSPGPLIELYRTTMTKYESKYASDADLSGGSEASAWQVASFVVDAMTGTVKSANELSPTARTKFGTSMTNWNAAGLGDPARSFAPNCKTGTDSTIWAYWTWNSSQNTLEDKVVAPAQGATHLINNDWLGMCHCYLTQLADKYYS
jgi:hypothetical protein